MAKKFRRVCHELTTVPIVSVPMKNSPLVPTIDSVNTKTSVPVLQSCSEPTETSDSESIFPMHVPTRTHSMARHRKSPRSQRYLMVFDPLTPSQGHQFDPRVKIFSVSWSAAHPL